MDNYSLSTIIGKFSIADIEKQLVLQYLDCHNIEYKKHSFFKDYFKGFVCDNNLKEAITNLHHYELEEIVMDMELLIPDNDRALNGAFFTPSYIVDYIVNTVNPGIDETVLDTSCGSGAFLLGAVKYYHTHYSKSISSIIKENIYGADILDYNVRRAKLLLILYALSNGEHISDKDINIIHCDSLKHSWRKKYDVIVSNPPYIKFQDLSEENREFLFNNYSTTNTGTFNIYFAFFELGLKLLSKNGRLGFITPNNYFTSLSAQPLRSFFETQKCIYKIIDFDALLIFEAQTYTAITFLNKKKNDGIQFAKLDSGQDVKDFLNNADFTDNQYSDLSVKKWRLLTGNKRYNIEQIENIGDSIGSIFDICCSIATLKDIAYFFIPSRQDEKYFYLNNKDTEYKIEKEITRKLVKISEMKDETDIENNERRIIFPYTIINDKAIIIPENELKEKYPYCYKYLLSQKDLLASRGKGTCKYDPFYQYGRNQTLNKTGYKILTPTFSKFPRFMIDRNSDGLFVNGYGIYFRPNNGSLFNHPLSDIKNIDVTAKILNSYIMHYYIKCTSISIQGGYPCFQKNFIEKFTIPNLSEKEINEIRKMTDKKELDEYLIKLYHLNLSTPNLSE